MCNENETSHGPCLLQFTTSMMISIVDGEVPMMDECLV